MWYSGNLFTEVCILELKEFPWVLWTFSRLSKLNFTMSYKNFKNFSYQMRASSGLTYFLLIIQYQYPVKDLLPRFWSQAPSQQLDSFISNLHLCCLSWRFGFLFFVFLPWGNVLDKIRNGSEVCCFLGRRAIAKEVVQKESADHSTFLGKLGKSTYEDWGSGH